MAVNPRLSLTHAAAPPPAQPAPQTVTATPAERTPEGARDMTGTINTMAKAFVTHAAPVVTQQILPALRADTALHRSVGSAVGKSVAQELKPFAVLATGAVVVGVGVYAWKALRPRRRR